MAAPGRASGLLRASQGVPGAFQGIPGASCLLPEHVLEHPGSVPESPKIAQRRPKAIFESLGADLLIFFGTSRADFSIDVGCVLLCRHAVRSFVR